MEEFKIFNNVNYTVLIEQLEELAANIPDDTQPLAQRELPNRFLQINTEAVKIDKELGNLSVKESKKLENYLYANLLILKCKEAAVRVSPKTWAGIEDRMLRFVGD